MPFDGNGNFAALSPPDYPAVAGQVIYSDRFNAVVGDILAGLSEVLPRDGQASPTGDIPMGGFHLTGLPTADTSGHAVEYAQYLAAIAALQPLDTDLTALAGVSTTGLLARTGAGAAAARTLTAGAGIQITNGDGVSGNPTIAVTAGAGLGDVTGPAGATAGNVAVLDATGKVLSDGGVAPAALMPKAGGNFTGDVTVPSLNGGQLAGLRNKIFNGAMLVAQRGTSFAAASGYTLDRWAWGAAGAGVVTASQQSDVPSGNEFQQSLRIAVTTADASIAAGDVYVLRQSIEGYNIGDLVGQDFTISFRVRSSKTGTHCVALRNSGADRTYVLEYTVNAADTWESKTLTVPGGLITAGTWNLTNGIGLNLTWALAVGSTFQTTANAWQVGNFQATANQVNCLDTIGNIFAITGVQVEVGDVSTPFERRPYGMELALCQRYYYRMTVSGASQVFADGKNISTTQATFLVNLPVTMRVAATALEQSGTAGDYDVQHAATSTACSAVVTLSVATPWAARIVGTVAAGLTTGQGCSLRSISTTAYIGLTAEL